MEAYLVRAKTLAVRERQIYTTHMSYSIDNRPVQYKPCTLDEVLHGHGGKNLIFPSTLQ